MRDDKPYSDTDDTLREQLSALLDDELELDQSRFLLSRLQHDRALSSTLDRYQLIQQCLRQESLDRLGDQRLRARVRVALENTEQENPVQQPRAIQRWARPLGGVAVAASVALMAIFGVESLRETTPATGLSPAPVAQQPAMPSLQPQMALDTVSLPLDSQTSIQPVAHTQVMPARLNQYLRGPGVRQVVEGQQPVRYIYLVRPASYTQPQETKQR